MRESGGRPDSRRLEALGHLTGGVAHDLNNLLMIVLGNIEMLEDIAEREAGEAKDMLRSLSKTALAATERASLLSRKLAAFARRRQTEPGGSPLHPALKATGELIERALGRRTTLVFDLAAEHDMVDTDVQQLETALVLLALSGEEAGRDREMRLSTRNEAGCLAIALEHRDGTAAPEDVLGFARAIVGSGGGSLRAGTPVTLMLPLIGQPDAAVPVRGGLSVLVADGREAVGAMAATQLRRLGCRPLSVASADAAFETLEGVRIDLLIVEMDLGYGRDGATLIREARARRPDLPAILVADSLGLAAAAAGNGDLGLLLARPYTQRELAEALREAVSGG